jgi:hypothetical protein
MLFDQLFTWPTDQPRHATDTYGDPVKSNRPLTWLRSLWSFLQKAYLGQIETTDVSNPIGIPSTVNRPQPPRRQ